MIEKMDSDVVIAVDLDGTLIYTDTLYESLLLLLRQKFAYLLLLPYWLVIGKAHLKSRVSSLVDLNPKTLPYNHKLINWLTQLRATGRKIVLCTAADKKIADQISNHLGIFDIVLASDGTTNNSKESKRKLLEENFGKRNFDYVGNSFDDLPAWQGARKAVVVNAGKNLIETTKSVANVEKIIPRESIKLTNVVHVFRVHQWLKNLLLFVPYLAAHKFENTSSIATLSLAFFAFSLCASSIYIANDLLDLDNDRRHPRKKFRPFASGSIEIKYGLLLFPILTAISLYTAYQVNTLFLVWVLSYLCLTSIYSFSLKKYPLIDVFFLALLYTLRIIAGAAAADLPHSFWLLAFSIFIFLSLAFVKRYAEINVSIEKEEAKINGRGYLITDAPLIQSLGVASGCASVLVLAFYLNSPAILLAYKTSEFMWGGVLAVFFWVNWVWLKAHRSEVHDDPLIFAMKDRVSQTCFLLASIAMFFAVTF